jgi:hypothetical protein
VKTYNLNRIALLSFAAAVATPFISSKAIQNPQELGGTPEDVNLAENDPFQYAWKLFFFLNHQAKKGVAGEADTSKASIKEYDGDTPVVWETWACATGGLFLEPGQKNTSEVYLDKGAEPPTWESLPRGVLQTKIFEPSLTNIDSLITNGMMGLESIQGRARFFFAPEVVAGSDDEIRMNRPTFEFIRAHKLYSVEGQQAAFKQAFDSDDPGFIQFPSMSKEVKARWIKIQESDKPRYHWRSIVVTKEGGSKETQIWGLSGLHIITRDLPNWFWTDFEHVDQEVDGTKEGRPSIDPTTRGQNPPFGKDGIRNETVGSKWENYRLRGAQINFTDRFGTPIELSNTLIEPKDSGPSSCITCHANATISSSIRPGAKPPFVIKHLPAQFVLGLPHPEAFKDQSGHIKFLPTDFVWSMSFRAHSQTEQ